MGDHPVTGQWFLECRGFKKIEGPEPWQGGNLWLDLKLAAFGTR